MPQFPKSKKRPWQSHTKAQSGRKVKTNFYHKPEWRKVRKLYINTNPLCEECLRNGKTTPGTMVDHIKPINREDPYNTHNGIYGEPLDESNLQTLCERCHAKKSAKERWGK